MRPLTPRTVRYARRAAALWCAAAVGALLFSIRVATTVFKEMPTDRILAGRIAGRSFTGAYAISTAAAVLALAVVWVARSRRSLVDRALAGTLLVVALGELFWIAPAIARHGEGWPGSFASLHAFGGGLHVGLAAIALLLAWRLACEADDTA